MPSKPKPRSANRQQADAYAPILARAGKARAAAKRHEAIAAVFYRQAADLEAEALAIRAALKKEAAA